VDKWARKILVKNQGKNWGKRLRGKRKRLAALPLLGDKFARSPQIEIPNPEKEGERRLNWPCFEKSRGRGGKRGLVKTGGNRERLKASAPRKREELGETQRVNTGSQREKPGGQGVKGKGGTGQSYESVSRKREERWCSDTLCPRRKKISH